MYRLTDVPPELCRPIEIPDHPLRGTLYRGALSKSVINHSLANRYGDIKVLQGRIPDIEIFLLDVTNNDVVTQSKFMAFHYSSFIMGEGDLKPDQEELVGAMLGLLFNMIDYTGILASNHELAGHCAKAGFRPIFRIISSREDILAIADHSRTQAFLKRFGGGVVRFVQDRAQQVVMAGLILLTIGKNFQMEGYPGWISKHIRAFMRTLGLESTDIIWSDSTYPAIYTMNALATYLSASFLLRREIFRICWAMASGQDQFCNLFKDVVGLLKGTGMKHIILIDEYLYKKHKELLSIELLSRDQKWMLAAWKYLASLPENERFFAKILYDREATACLDRHNFPLHAAAAEAAARFENPSVPKYRVAGGQSQSSAIMESVVNTYLTSKLYRSPKASMNEMAQFSSPHEVVEYNRLVDRADVDQVDVAGSSQERGQPAFLPSPPAWQQPEFIPLPPVWQQPEFIPSPPAWQQPAFIPRPPTWQ